MEGLIGAVIGGILALAGTWIQSRYQAKRERRRLAIEVGLEHHRRVWERESNPDTSLAQPRSVKPFHTYCFLNMKILELIEADNLTAETMQKVIGEAENFAESGIPETDKYWV